MNVFQSIGAFCVISGVSCLCFPMAASAGVFTSLGGKRSVHMIGELSAFNLQDQTNTSTAFNEDDDGGPGDLGHMKLGMDISLTEVNCFAQGVASQNLVVLDDSINFSGVADVNISGTPAFPYEFNGSGGAFVAMEYKFAVKGQQAARLAMNSQVGTYKEDDFIFRLSASDGRVLWSGTALIDERGNTIRDYEIGLSLAEGQYTVSVQMRASSYMLNDLSSPGRTLANFSISAVPEPAMSTMFLVGFASLGGLMYARRRHPATLNVLAREGVHS